MYNSIISMWLQTVFSKSPNFIIKTSEQHSARATMRGHVKSYFTSSDFVTLGGKMIWEKFQIDWTSVIKVEVLVILCMSIFEIVNITALYLVQGLRIVWFLPAESSRSCREYYRVIPSEGSVLWYYLVKSLTTKCIYLLLVTAVIFQSLLWVRSVRIVEFNSRIQWN